MNTVLNKLEWSNERTVCPQCGAQRSFAPLQESPEYGKCFSCGKFSPPPANGSRCRQFPRQLDHINDKQLVRRSPEERPQMFIDDMEAMETMGRLLMPGTALLGDAIEAVRQQSPFHGWLIDQTDVPHIFLTWSIGLDSVGDVLFWYENEQGEYVNCKIIRYKPDSHRDKSIPPRYMYGRKDGFRQCLFGAFQLNKTYHNAGYNYDRYTSTVLVESEKTAVICSVHEPTFLWLATGGAQGLTEEKATLLRNFKDVTVWYDADVAGRSGARKALDVLSKVNVQARNYDPCPDLDDGTDAADLIDNYSIGRVI